MFLYDLAEAGISLAYVSKEFRHTHLEISFEPRVKRLDSIPFVRQTVRFFVYKIPSLSKLKVLLANALYQLCFNDRPLFVRYT